MIRIVVSVAAFVLAILLILASGFRLPFRSSNQPTSNQSRSGSPGLLDRLLNRNRPSPQQSPPAATGFSTGTNNQAQPGNQGTASPTQIAPLNAPQPANPRADLAPSPTIPPGTVPSGVPAGSQDYSAQITGTGSRGTGADRPPSTPNTSAGP
ncbi:MAG: hypothetical protein NZ772_06470, partial [Cyanobacteria bacterium]|nr:hypothetical protein [Cyanobacteriota bacterium]MDW8201131.1 hypothetical protein [Cyanobacteriota bacterium SKYGB_h_bin112]